MLPYALLLIFTLLFSFVARTTVIKNKVKVTGVKIGNTEYIKNNNLAITIFFITFFFILSLRAIHIGRDVPVYQYYFNEYSKISLGEVFKLNGDTLYILLNWTIAKLTGNYQVFLSVVAGIVLFPIYKTYNKDKRKAFMKIIIFMNMPVFIMFFSGLRQSIAISIGMIAYKYVKEKKVLPFIISVLIATGFHHSAFVLFLLYPVYHLRMKRKSLFIIVPMSVAIYLFNKPIFSFILNILNKLSNGQYNTSISSTGAVTTIILFSLFLILSYVITDESLMDYETLGLRNILMLALWIQFFAPLHNLAMRFNYYFIIFVPMVMPRVIACSKTKYRSIAKLAEIIITCYLLFYYSKNTYRACITGRSSLDIYPYVPFWKIQ